MNTFRLFWFRKYTIHPAHKRAGMTDCVSSNKGHYQNIRSLRSFQNQKSKVDSISLKHKAVSSFPRIHRLSARQWFISLSQQQQTKKTTPVRENYYSMKNYSGSFAKWCLSRWLHHVCRLKAKEWMKWRELIKMERASRQLSLPQVDQLVRTCLSCA